VAWEINGVHRVRCREEGRQTAEIFELRPDRMRSNGGPLPIFENVG